MKKRMASMVLTVVLATSLMAMPVFATEPQLETDELATETIDIEDEFEEVSETPEEPEDEADETQEDLIEEIPEDIYEEASEDTAEEVGEESTGDDEVANPESDEDDYGIELLDESDLIELTSAGGELSSGNYYLSEDVTLENDITIPEEADVTIDLNGYILNGTGNDSAITNYGIFTLNDSSGNNSGEITGPTNSQYISVPYGGSVNNNSSGQFIMNGGKICNNIVSHGGGGVYNTGTFTLTGGEISDNTVTKSYCNGGGVHNSGTFIMTGGKISNNTATLYSGGGVYNDGTFTLTGGDISNNVAVIRGGGVYNTGTFTMTDSEIHDNSAKGSDGYGCGVYNTGTFTMTDSEIYNNSTKGWNGSGGGVFNTGTFTMEDSKIYSNSISGQEGTGGGVYNTGYFTMMSGKIYENSVCSIGGGVYTKGTFTMSGGEISENSSDNNGGGVYCNSASTLIFSNEIIIKGNTTADVDNNIYLVSGLLIRLKGKLTEGSYVGITTQNQPKSGSPVQITETENDTDYYESSAQYFFSDDGYSTRAHELNHCVEIVSGAIDISECTISLSPMHYTYDGKYKNPSVTVQYGQKTLTEDVDYTFSYNNNLKVGTATVTVTGIWNYTGTATKDFTIYAIYLSDCTITLSQTSYVYDGNKKEPKVTVKYGSTTLKNGTDYTVSYIDNRLVGEAMVTITGQGNYTGRITKTFTIQDATDVRKASDGKWYYYVNGKKNTSYTGFATNSSGKWYVEKGIVTKSTNGVFKDKTGAIGKANEQYYVLDSKVQTGFTGLANYSNSSGWWYITKGKVDSSYNGLAKNKNGWFYLKNGKVDRSYTGFASNSSGKWYVSSGKVTKTKNGVLKDKTGAIGKANEWYYVLNSKVQTSFTGLANYSNSSGWWYITKGKVDRSYNGLAKNKNGWFYLTNGKVSRSYTGLATNSNGTWYVKNGKVQKSYTGTVTINGKKYSVANGKVKA